MQTYTSANTSINSKKSPMVYSNTTAIDIMRNKKVIDIGGGKYDTMVEKAKEYNAIVKVYDPYNRTEEHNNSVLADDYDIAIISNVLNVIDSNQARQEVVRLASEKANTIIITIYEGNKSCVGGVSKKDCWQENRPTADYLEEIKTALPLYKVEIKGKVIVARREV